MLVVVVFAPGAGIPENPVTGSSHLTLIPYWSERLTKTCMKVKQLSKGGRTIFCNFLGNRVVISGKAVTHLIGEILL